MRTSRPSHLCPGREMKEQEEQGGGGSLVHKDLKDSYAYAIDSIFKAIKSVMLHLDEIDFFF